MKSKFTFLLMVLLFCKIGYSQETYVPDDNFEQALIDLGYDTILDDYVTTANISGVTFLTVDSINISDLTGIEDFTSLTYLNCSSNQLTSLDVSQNTSLTYINCYNNMLTSLDVSQNIALIEFYCSNNQLTSLDVSQNIEIVNLSCNDNQLSSLDVTPLVGLEALNIFDNQISSLDITQNIFLDDLDCKNNLLTNLDVSQNTALTLLSCRFNQITSLDVSQNLALIELVSDGNQLTSLDVSQNSLLTYFNCASNQLTSLNVKNGNNINFSGFRANNNPDLYCIEVDDANYSMSNWTDIDEQTEFSEDCNLSISDLENIASIDIYSNPAKERFHISTQQNATFKIISINGQVLKNGRIEIGENTVNTSLLARGVYIIHIKNENGTYIKKMVIN